MDLHRAQAVFHYSITQKPLAIQNNGAVCKCYQIVINRGKEKPQTLDTTGLAAWIFLFPLDCSGGFGGYVVDYAVDVSALVSDAV